MNNRQNMSMCVEKAEVEDKSEFPGSGCLSMKSSQSKQEPLSFSCQHGHQEGRPKGQSRPLLERAQLFSEEPKPSHIGLPADTSLNLGLEEHKLSLRRRCAHVTEGAEEPGSRTLLNNIYTELYITQSQEVNTQHEVNQLETAAKRKKITADTPIKCCDIFKASPDQQGFIRVVLTNGVAGVGKTFSVMKFTLDWAEGLENQDVNLLVLFSFRELNLIRDQKFSLLRLLQVFHPTLEKITAEKLTVCQLLFIFDGLDESRLSLDFNDMEVVTDVRQTSSVNVLLTNLIQGNLLPSALIWITSRPAAANQIPPTCVHRVTEVQGFTDDQKDQYFRKRTTDEELSNRIISHVRMSKSLHTMCQIPVFCWISATVLEHMLTSEQRGELPITLTDLYSHFLLVQTKRKKNKYSEEVMEAQKEVLQMLCRLAFEQLQKGNIMFYQEDLAQCGLDLTQTMVYSGICTEIFRRESVIFQKTVYSFVHLSLQEFLAAVHVFHCYTNKNMEVLKDLLGSRCRDQLTLDNFVKIITEKTVRDRHGHLDLFVRFLHGLCLESNQQLLGDLVGQTHFSPENIQNVIANLKNMYMYNVCPDKSINVFHCLTEMRDQTVHLEIQEFLKSEDKFQKSLTAVHCSALAYILQMSEEVLEEVDVSKYYTTQEGKLCLVPLVRNSRKARFAFCQLSTDHTLIIASALKSDPSHLRELDLKGNIMCDQAVEQLCSGLQSSNCRLETLSLVDCLLQHNYDHLASALRSNPFHLKNLDLTKNCLNDGGVKELCGYLKSPDCRLESLKLGSNFLTKLSCSHLASSLMSNPSHLRELDLSQNPIEDAGVKELCDVLQSPQCHLVTLCLVICNLSELSCSHLASALTSNPAHLRELDLSLNPLLDSGVKELCRVLQSPQCGLETLRLFGCQLSGVSCSSLAVALKSNPLHLKNLDLTGNGLLLWSEMKPITDLVQSLDYRLETIGSLRLSDLISFYGNVQTP